MQTGTLGLLWQKCIQGLLGQISSCLEVSQVEKQCCVRGGVWVTLFKWWQIAFVSLRELFLILNQLFVTEFFVASGCGRFLLMTDAFSRSAREKNTKEINHLHYTWSGVWMKPVFIFNIWNAETCTACLVMINTFINPRVFFSGKVRYFQEK